jgi:hypothetical protein
LRGYLIKKKKIDKAGGVDYFPETKFISYLIMALVISGAAIYRKKDNGGNK